METCLLNIQQEHTSKHTAWQLQSLVRSLSFKVTPIIPPAFFSTDLIHTSTHIHTHTQTHIHSVTYCLCGPSGQAGTVPVNGKNRPGPGESWGVPPRPGRAIGLFSIKKVFSIIAFTAEIRGSKTLSVDSLLATICCFAIKIIRLTTSGTLGQPKIIDWQSRICSCNARFCPINSDIALQSCLTSGHSTKKCCRSSIIKHLRHNGLPITPLVHK